MPNTMTKEKTIARLVHGGNYTCTVNPWTGVSTVTFRAGQKRIEIRISPRGKVLTRGKTRRKKTRAVV